MRKDVTFALIAVALLGAGYFASEALARGGGGGGRGGHGGMSSGWRGLSMSGGHMSGGHNMFGRMSHMSRFPFKGQNQHGMQNFGHSMMHHHQLAQGQWHSMPGFGSHGQQKWANMQGVWHKVPGFGRRGQNKNARDFRRDWQTGGGDGGGGGWVIGVNAGDLCMYTGMCQGQGVWQVVPQATASRAHQPRTIKRDWQVGEEL